MTEQIMRELIEQDGLTEEVARLRLRDKDLWLLPPWARFDEDLQGEEGVRLWEEAARAARTVADGISGGPDTIKASPAVTMLVWDAADRAEAALARARTRQHRATRPAGEITEYEEKKLQELLRRSDALGNAYATVLDSKELIPERKEEMLEALGELNKEAEERFERYRREIGLPDPKVSR